MKLTTDSHLMPRLGMSGVISSLPHTPSWLAEGEPQIDTSIVVLRMQKHI
jgi:hypothetical protein